MRTPQRSLIVLAAAAIGLLAGTPAWSGPDYSASSDIIEPNGFPGVCAQPCYVAGIETEVWLPTNPDNPAPLAGNQTFVYKVTHTGGSGPFVPALLNFELAVDLAEVISAGVIATSPGVDPSGVQLFNGAVTWEFNTTPIADGESSKLLYIHSPLLPGAVENNAASVAGQAALDAPGSCLGPLDPPAGSSTYLTTVGNGTYSGNYLIGAASLAVEFDEVLGLKDEE